VSIFDRIEHPFTDPRLLPQNLPDWAPPNPTQVYSASDAAGGDIYADADGRLYRGPQFAEVYQAFVDSGTPTDWGPYKSGFRTGDKITSGQKNDPLSRVESGLGKSVSDLKKAALIGGGLLILVMILTRPQPPWRR
jgi:hypothetical protein